MASTPIASLRDDDASRHVLSGVVTNLRTRTYSGGMMMMFDLEDTSGTIPVIGFDDAYTLFHGKLQENGTYMFYNMQVRPNVRNGNRLETKLFHDTRIEATTANIRFERTTIADAKTSKRENVRLCAFITQYGEEVETTRTGRPMRRCTIIDSTGELSMFLFDDLASEVFADGTIVNVDGRISESKTVFANSVVATENEHLAALYSSYEPPKKRMCAEICSLADVRTAEIGTRGTFTAIVRSCSMIPTPMGNDRVRHHFSLVDPSMAAVELAVFCSAHDNIEVPVGATVQVKATVNAFNTRSLTSNAITVVSDAMLDEWWQSLKDPTFKEISVDSRGADRSFNANASDAQVPGAQIEAPPESVFTLTK